MPDNDTQGETNMAHIYRILAAVLATLFLVSATAEEAAAPAAGLFTVAADGDQPDSEISKLAGVAPFFHLYDAKGQLVEVVPNPFLDLEFGVGPAATSMLADKGAAVLIGRQMPGPKLMDVVAERKMRFVRRFGTVQDVAKELQE
jgi:predicted Fe-Mo cluster-binding NifX family protein